VVDRSLAKSIPRLLKDISIVLTLKFVYDLDGKRATLISISEDISILAYKQARNNKEYLAG
jgi:hypothetical protein